jgi:hypothetical protein
MGALEQTTMEMTLAAELVDGLAPDSSETRVESDRILVRLRKHGWKLTHLIFSKESLRRLAEDRHREIKMEYLEREIEQMAGLRRTYAYPRRMSRCA